MPTPPIGIRPTHYSGSERQLYASSAPGTYGQIRREPAHQASCHDSQKERRLIQTRKWKGRSCFRGACLSPGDRREAKRKALTSDSSQQLALHIATGFPGEQH